ncbi:uncharacterized protein JN550_013434 [Neoarthrinium moseri]|uniref:uncharacterized protein n=1 Tax=Neoarthrinium moseri TaxID=1658444 RepID=UPI001FDD1F2F|nr:uncharacterized protein JN550_013434 [Neoarthrinium moseri]KAI1857197.1 hypothetical protein JN550_013434 [Neoarthrinium moseri]
MLSLLKAAWIIPFCFSSLPTALCVPFNSKARSPPARDFFPRGLRVGTELDTETGDFASFTLDDTSLIATLDYGTERGGYPFFLVADVSQPVQIEVKYSESFVGLAQPWADGPYPFSTGLANSYRVETFNVTSPGRITAPLIQGGQRWESIRLVTSGSITFETIGLEATVDTTEIEDFPGQFSSNDEQLNSIWKLGAVAASTACVEEGTQLATWEIDPVTGAFIRSQRASQTLAGPLYSDYTLSFDTMIDRGGVWWAMAFPLARGEGLQLQLISDLPEGSTFANVNKTQTPANSVLLSYGYDFVNQTTLTSYYLDTFAVPFAVAEKTWHHVTTALSPGGRLSVSINGQVVVDISITDYWTPAPVSFTGSFGFGAWQDQAAYVRNVSVSDTINGTVIYTNPMTSVDVLAEYGTQTNLGSVCLDGPKRDRLVWLGDFYHTARIIGSSTSRFDLTKGTLEFFLRTQIANGEMNIAPPMGYDPSITAPFTPFGSYGLSDYQLLGLDGVHSYIRQTNDLGFLRETWPQWKLLVDWTIGKVNSTDGLIYVPSAFLGPSQAGSAVSCLAVQALQQLSELAQAVGDDTSKSRCDAAAQALSDAVNRQLWNEDLGVYSLSTSDKGNFSVAGIAFCLASGVSTQHQTARALAALDGLSLSPGYKDSTAASSTDPTVVISPNTNGFLLDALFKSGAYTTGHQLIKSLWGTMVNNKQTSSGASWEYVDQSGNPGLSYFTSLAHPWGGAATYVLTEWAAGIRLGPGPEGFGYKHWIIAPEAGLAMGLQTASARVKTPAGFLAVEWTKSSKDEVTVRIDAPPATYGTFKFGNETKSLCGQIQYTLVRKISS